ncbi:hypothetical protein FRX31_013310 [Thalictrum thalictroides]|uniref:Uncharacterized protein n=1 Tax=Thalictrum thalictroides TaxID=46969 RepID=A0A7J6WIA3_THATH|nr:hypothetical protein FRX31_013310 [Thalictrum thalictroides]
MEKTLIKVNEREIDYVEEDRRSQKLGGPNLVQIRPHWRTFSIGFEKKKSSRRNRNRKHFEQIIWEYIGKGR